MPTWTEQERRDFDELKERTTDYYNGQALPKAVHSTACGNAVLGAVFFWVEGQEVIR